jgi:tellurite resistance protein
MNQEQQKAILTIALYAAFADGSKDDSEREQTRQQAETLDMGRVLNMVRGNHAASIV